VPGRVLLNLTVLALTFGAVVRLVADEAQSYQSEEDRVLALTNTARAAVGLPPVVIDADLTATARFWAARMAALGDIPHSPGRAPDVYENVGTGESVDDIQDGFEQSAGHYANIVDPAVGRVGIGVAYDGQGMVYVAVEFLAGLTPPVFSPPLPGPGPPAVSPPPPADPPLPARLVEVLERLRALDA